MDALAWELFDPALAPCGEDLRPFLCEALDRSSRWFAADSASAFLSRGGGEYVLEAQAGAMGLPFGVGPRVCIGATFSLQEAAIILATIMRNFELLPAPGFKVEPIQRITLRPRDGMQLVLQRRS